MFLKLLLFLSYSSNFLRETADHQGASTSLTNTHNNNDLFELPKNKNLISTTTNKSSKLIIEFQLKQQQKWIIVNNTSISSKSVIGQSYWGGSAQEPGTVWPHLQEVPAICTVDILSKSSANLSIVDGELALVLLAKKHPDAFEFLAQCELEYSIGIFRSRHSIVNMKKGKILPVI